MLSSVLLCRAADWLFSHSDELDVLVPGILHPAVPVPVAGSSAATAAAPTDELVYDDSPSSRYELIAVITHMGKNTDHGHYVSHIRRAVDGELRWVLYNDEKVAVTTKPPLKFGYMYLYRRL